MTLCSVYFYHGTCILDGTYIVDGTHILDGTFILDGTYILMQCVLLIWYLRCARKEQFQLFDLLKAFDREHHIFIIFFTTEKTFLSFIRAHHCMSYHLIKSAIASIQH